MEKYILALEIGSSKVKGAVGVIDNDGLLSVTAVEEEKFSDSVRHGLIINVETVSNRVNSIVRKLENRVSPRKIKSVYVGIGGRSFMSAPREVERQLPAESEITAELVDQLRGEALSSALSDRDVVAVADGEFYVDHTLRNNPVGTYGRNLKATFNLITCRQQVIRNLRRAITERLGLKINDTFVRQLAEAELVMSSDQRRQGCMLVDMGAETTTVSIYKFGALRYMATIPMGSRNITRDIASLNYLEERADELKIIGGNAMPQNSSLKNNIEGIDFSDINNIVTARASEIIVNINEQVKYSKLNNSDLPGGIVLIGGGAKLKGFSELMEKITKMRVSAGMPSATVRISDVRIPGYESIDVISILNAAARHPEVQECMEAPAPVKPVEEPHDTPAETVAEAPEPEPREEDTSRIGTIDREEDEEVEIIPARPPRLKGWFRRMTENMEALMRDPVEEDDDLNDLK